MKNSRNKGHIYLVGFMGAGKSTVGKALSKRLNRPLVDLDTIISENLGMSVSDLFVKKGESFFRDTETRFLRNISSDDYLSVISTGGGVVLRDENWEIMNSSGTVIYLKADIIEIWKRIKNDSSRPLLNVDDPFKEAEKILESRKKLYEKADFTVRTDNLIVDKVAESIENLLFT